MNRKNSIQVPGENNATQPIVCSYDTSYEHSLEHYFAVRSMVEKLEASGAAVSGIYRNHDAVDHAVDALGEAGFRNADISILFADDEPTNTVEFEKKPTASEVKVRGGLRWLAGTGALAIAGVGPLSAVDPIVSAPIGAGADGIIGSVADALVSMGVREHEAKRYEASVKDGGVLLSVRADDADWIGRAKGVLESTRAAHISVTGERGAQPLPRAS